MGKMFLQVDGLQINFMAGVVCRVYLEASTEKS
jgi:hypothetical protein